MKKSGKPPGAILFEDIARQCELLVEDFNLSTDDRRLLLNKNEPDAVFEIVDQVKMMKLIFYYFREKVAFRWYITADCPISLPAEFFNGVLSSYSIENGEEIRLNHNQSVIVENLLEKLFSFFGD